MRDLVERAEALQALDGALDEAADGRGSVALLTGEPGIGKTALMACFAERHGDDARVLTGLCDDLATPRPLAPFRDIAQALGGPPAESLRDASAPGAFTALLLDELSRGRAPTVLVLEDVHWADQATVDALTVLGRRLATLPVLLVLTFRSGEIDPGDPLWGALDALHHTTSLTLDLPPLSRDGVAALSGEDADRIFALTGGNPFFVTELIASREGPPPPSLANAVLARVARLDDGPRELLELVAMVPGRVDTAVLDRVDPGWAEQAEQAERRQLLTSDPQHVRFCHELTRAAVRSSVPPVRRRLLHRSILEAMQDVGAEPADLVHHAEAAGVTAVVAEHAVPAARQAEALGSYREALAHLRRAARFTDRLPPAEQARLWEDLAGTACLVGHGKEAIAAATQAIELSQRLGDDEGAGRCTGLRSHLLWFTGEGEAAWGDACAAVRQLTRAGSAPELARAYVGCAELAMLASRADDALCWGVRALELAWDDDAVRSRALAALGATRMQLDPTDTGTLLEALDTARAAGEHHQVVLIHTSLAFVSLQWVLPDTAMAHADQGSRYAADHEVDTMAGYLDAVRAWLLQRGGRAEDAARLARTTLHRAETGGVTVTGLVARTVLTERAVRRGDDDADALLSELVADADRTGELKRIAPVFELQLERALTCGDPLPVQRLDEIARIVGRQPLRRGGAGARLAAWTTVCGREHCFDGPAPAPYAAMMRGDWSAAADAFGRAGWAHDQALLLSLADSRTALAEALDIARSCGARPLEHRIRHRMRDRGLTVPRGPLASTRANPAGLTDRQLEVLAMLRDGLGNAAIAARLHISPRTVEHHVAGILTRLGVTSRGEAAARSVALDTDE